jgi:hypothetical protein
MLGRSTSARRQDAAEIPVSLASGDFAVRRIDVRFEQRASICADLLHEAQNDTTFVNSVIAEDESLFFQYDMDKRTAT